MQNNDGMSRLRSKELRFDSYGEMLTPLVNPVVAG